jgi:hypothetical protein
MIYAVGDVHGCLEKLKNLLEREGVTENNEWAADNAHLVFLGDYTDRGEDGIGVIEHIMHLERQAKSAGGQVTALLGNHDLLLLEAHWFGEEIVHGLLKYGKTKSFLEMWLDNGGGKPSDLQRLTSAHVQWLQTRPVMFVNGETLFLHADSDFYLEYGKTVQEINHNIGQILSHHDSRTVDLLEERFCKRKQFLHDPDLAQELAAHFGAKRIVHGHTPIHMLQNLEAKAVFEPFVYANGICTNLDHGLCYGGEGFVLRLAQ